MIALRSVPSDSSTSPENSTFCTVDRLEIEAQAHSAIGVERFDLDVLEAPETEEMRDGFAHLRHRQRLARTRLDQIPRQGVELGAPSTMTSAATPSCRQTARRERWPVRRGLDGLGGEQRRYQNEHHQKTWRTRNSMA